MSRYGLRITGLKKLRSCKAEWREKGSVQSEWILTDWKIMPLKGAEGRLKRMKEPHPNPLIPSEPCMVWKIQFKHIPVKGPGFFLTFPYASLAEIKIERLFLFTF